MVLLINTSYYIILYYIILYYIILYYIILISADESGVPLFPENICPCFHVPQRLERDSIAIALAKKGMSKKSKKSTWAPGKEQLNPVFQAMAKFLTEGRHC